MIASLVYIVLATSYPHPSALESYVSLSLPDSVVVKSARSDLNDRRSSAKQAEIAIVKDGITEDKIITAMLVNMWHESRWNHKSASIDTNGVYSAGLFQLNQLGAGYGMTVEEMTDIDTHMDRLLSRPEYKRWKAWALKNHGSVTCGEIAYRFASDVERCAVAHRAPRKTTGDRWWKAMVNR